MRARSSGSSTAAPGITSGWRRRFPNAGDFIRSNVGPTPVVVSRAKDGGIAVFENRCVHRAAEFCRELTGNVKEFVCPYHQWTYDLKGKLQGVPFRRGVAGKGGMPKDFNPADHNPRALAVTTHRGVIFASYAADMESLAGLPGAGGAAGIRGDLRWPQAGHPRALPPQPAGQLEAVPREPEGPLSRDPAAYLPGDLRAAGRRQQVADARGRERPAWRDVQRQVGCQQGLGRKQGGDAGLQGRHAAGRPADHGFRRRVRQPLVRHHGDDLAEPDRAAGDEHARHPAAGARPGRTSSS